MFIAMFCQYCFFKLDEAIQTIPLSTSETDPKPKEIVTASGWGLPSDDALDTSNVLRDVDVPTESNEQCNDFYGIINDGHICTDATGGKGTCLVCNILGFVF